LNDRVVQCGQAVRSDIPRFREKIPFVTVEQAVFCYVKSPRPNLIAPSCLYLLGRRLQLGAGEIIQSWLDALCCGQRSRFLMQTGQPITLSRRRSVEGSGKLAEMSQDILTDQIGQK
ncbi:hypothetical protein RRG08_058600, partial [Elysia crispata]